MIQLNEIKKEDDVYFQGAFWIKGNSIKDIIGGNFELLCEKKLCDINGADINIPLSKNSLNHKNLWKSGLNGDSDLPFDYYPRGRVSIYNGTAFIHIHSILHTPKIIDAIIREYSGINKLEIEVERNDLLQGSHYDFKLK